MESFNNIFDIHDHSPDDNDNNNEELENILEEYNQDFDFDYIHTNVDEEEMIIDDDTITNNDNDDNQIFEEQKLSQKLSQLSTSGENDQEEQFVSTKKRPISTPSTPDVTSKKIRILDDNEYEKEQIPAYLQTSNESFNNIMTSHIRKSAPTAITLNDIQQLAILKHKIGVMLIRRELWTVYLKSGTGQLETQESCQTTIDRRFWSLEVKQRVLSESNNIDKDEQKLCEEIVQEHLDDLLATIEQYQNEFEETKYCLMGFTGEMEKAIEAFVQLHGLRPREMKLKYKIAMLQYDYDAQIVEREYLRHKPTQYQLQTAERFYGLRNEYVQSKQELIELKQRILCNKPPSDLINSISVSVAISKLDDTMMNDTVRRHLVDQQHKELQQNMTDSMALSLSEAENKVYECRALLNEEIRHVSASNDNNIEGLTGNLIDLIYRRFNIINKKLDYLGNFRLNYFVRNYYGDEQEQIHRAALGFSPTMIMDTSLHHLTNEQLKLLNRGPSYIPPCQSYVSSSYLSLNDMIQKQYKLLQHHLNIIFAKHDINSVQSMFINKEIKDLYTSIFSVPLPLSLHQRALHEKQIVQSIREHLKANNLILRRTADRRNVFYLGNRKEFEEKAKEYMRKTYAFEFGEIIDPTNLPQTHEYLSKIIKSMNSELERIFNNQKLYKDLLKMLYIDMNKVQLPYLYFLPDVSKKNEVSLKPVVVSRYSVTSRLARFLDGLLRPVIQRHMESTIFVNGADFIRKLNRYTDDQHQFHSKTLFATIEISNFYTMVPHATMLIVLETYLRDQLAVPAIENISINKIIDLTSLFLKNNRFYYDNTIYRFTRGSPQSLALSETLCHIYVIQWQKSLLNEPLMKGEFYGRCKNQIFLTWNQTANELCQILKTIGSQHKNVQLEIKIGFIVQFLNAHIENLNGTLYSRVHHNQHIQKYTLPYVYGNSKAAHSHWLRSSLIRAVRYCTSVFDFHQERIYLEVTCLTNGYSLEFVERRIQHFFTHFDAISLRTCLDQRVYDQLRHRLYNFISEQQQFVDTNQALEKRKQLLRLSYLYEYGPKRQFNENLEKIVSKTLYIPPKTASENNKIKIILTTKQQYSLNALLSQQKTFSSIIK